MRLKKQSHKSEVDKTRSKKWSQKSEIEKTRSKKRSQKNEVKKVKSKNEVDKSRSKNWAGEVWLHNGSYLGLTGDIALLCPKPGEFY